MKKYIVLCSLLFIALFTGGRKANAENTEENKLGYSVNLVQPSTQIDPNTGYFYIQTKPGEKQTLEVRVKSTKNDPVTVKVSFANAITGNSGTLDYSGDDSLINNSLKNPITEIAKSDVSEVTVENFEEKTVHIELTPPTDHYQGVKMGVMVFTLDTEEQTSNGVATEFAYRIGLITAESGDEFNNGQSIQLNDVKASVVRGKKMVLANLSNPEPKLLENLTIDATMVAKGSNRVIKSKTVNNYTMAPNSQFDFEIDWGLDRLPAGEYTLNLNISNDYKKWKLSKEFSITNQQAKKINEESAFKLVTPSSIKISALILATIELITMIFLIIRRVSWEKSWKNFN